MFAKIIGSDSVEQATEWVFGPDGPVRAQGYDVRESQRLLALAAARRIDQRSGWTLGEAPTGCHARGQGVMMFDGSIKLVEDVEVGDALMGPDGESRCVLSLARGRQTMVDVVPNKGRTFRVNRDHILTFARTNSKISSDGVGGVRSYRPDPRDGQWIDVRTSDVLDHWSKWNKHIHKLVRVGVNEFGGDDRVLSIPPWELGVLLGDGGIKRQDAETTLTSVDVEVIAPMRVYLESIGCKLNKKDDRHYAIIGKVGYRNHPLRNRLRVLGLFGTHSATKFIPHVYKTSSRSDRLELLAGLIDTDGSNNNTGGFDFISKSEQLSNDVAFVARSLGLAAYVSPCRKSSQTGFTGDYWRVSISGDCTVVPVRIGRKRPWERRQKKDVLRTGFELHEREEEDYFGFELNGDGRFLLDDFTVTHNTGKGMAYLVPGVIAAIRAEMAWANGTRPGGEGMFRKLVVSTANIALQGQLVNKDIPAVAKLLGVEVSVALWKGRNNYLCLERVEEQAASLGFGDRSVRRLVDWTREPGCTGDKEDLTWDAGQAWSRLSVGSDECHGKKCPHYRPGQAESAPALCFAERARYGVARAHVVIVNHHLLSVQRPIPAVLLAVDEAHELESCMRSAVSGTVTERGAAAAAARVEKVLGPQQARRVSEPMEYLFLALGAYLDAHNARYSHPIVPGWHGGSYNADSLDGLREVAKLLGKAAKQATDENEAGKIEILADKIENLYVRAYTMAQGRPHSSMGGTAESPWAVWVDVKQEENARSGKRERKLTGQMAPADVSHYTMAMQRTYPAALLTSATLTVDRKFEYARNCLGLSKLGAPAEFKDVQVTGVDGQTTTERRQVSAAGPVEELALPSPYSLAEMGALVVPGDAPSTKDSSWELWATRRVIDVVRLARGRTLVLASSWKMMEKYGAALLNTDQPYPIKVQGEAGRNELIRWFKAETNGVLVGTRSFFQGLDVQGEACSCVVIDRVPFDPPGDPLEEAVGAMMETRANRPGSAFYLRSLPKTCMVLAQGAGRLIRSQSDRGVIVCLDSKVVSGGMAETIRASFPPFPLSSAIEDVENMLDGRPLVGVRAAFMSQPLVASTRITRGHRARA